MNTNQRNRETLCEEREGGERVSENEKPQSLSTKTGGAQIPKIRGACLLPRKKGGHFALKTAHKLLRMLGGSSKTNQECNMLS